MMVINSSPFESSVQIFSFSKYNLNTSFFQFSEYLFIQFIAGPKAKIQQFLLGDL